MSIGNGLEKDANLRGLEQNLAIPWPLEPQVDSQEGGTMLPLQVEVEAILSGCVERFKKPTYVPSPEEFEAMERFAERHIHVVLPRSGGFQATASLAGRFMLEDDPDKLRVPMRYFTKHTVDGIKDRKLNPSLARSFLDGISADRWALLGNEMPYATWASQKNEQARVVFGNSGGFSGLQKIFDIEGKQRKHGLLTWDEYVDTLPDSWRTEYSVLANGYKKYLERRRNLGAMIEQREVLGSEAA